MTTNVDVADTVLRNSPDIIVRYDLSLRRIYANPRFEALSGLRPEQYLGLRPSQQSPIGEMAAPMEHCLRSALATGRLQELDVEWRCADGRRLWLCVRIVVERDISGVPTSLLSMASDITARKQAERALAAREREFRSLAECSPDSIVLFDAQARLAYCNPELARRVGQPLERMLGLRAHQLALPGNEAELLRYEQALLEVLASGRSAELELRLLGPGGHLEVQHARLVAVRTDDGEVEGALTLSRDITQSVEQRERILALALTDPLTQLHNRQALQQIAPVMIQQALRQCSGVAMLLLDIDGFKSVNDALGHAAGDALLCVLAQRLSGCLRSSDLLVRLGGDEFAILLGNCELRAAATRVAEKIGAVLRTPVPMGERQLVPGASIGIAMCPHDGDTLATLMVHADIAMYEAKRAGRDRYAFYRPPRGAARGSTVHAAVKLPLNE